MIAHSDRFHTANKRFRKGQDRAVAIASGDDGAIAKCSSLRSSVTAKALMCALAALMAAMLAAIPAQAFAMPESVSVTTGRSIYYDGYNTTFMKANGNLAYCAEPTRSTPNDGSYGTALATESVTLAIWASFGSPGFDRSLFPESYGSLQDGSPWDDDAYIVAGHLLISYAYMNSKEDALYGITNADFKEWAESELLGTTWGKVQSLKNSIPETFEALIIRTSDAETGTTQTLASYVCSTANTNEEPSEPEDDPVAPAGPTDPVTPTNDANPTDPSNPSEEEISTTEDGPEPEADAPNNETDLVEDVADEHDGDSIPIVRQAALKASASASPVKRASHYAKTGAQAPDSRAELGVAVALAILAALSGAAAIRGRRACAADGTEADVRRS